jgi:hypothetical protein
VRFPLAHAAVLIASVPIACSSHLDCGEADQQAEAMLADFDSCASGEPCQALDVTQQLQDANEVGICIDALVCPVAVRAGADQAAFVRRARDIISRRRCNTCVMAKCQLPGSRQPVCDPTTKRCRLR